MSEKLSPRAAATSMEIGRALPPGDDDRAAGYGVIGLPFASGHYLALRNFHASSWGEGYRAVWHRNPAGEWSVYSTVPGELSCARYIGADLSRPTIVAPIDVTWLDDETVRVFIDDMLDWTIRVSGTPATRMMTSMSGQMPQWAWTSGGALGAMGRMASVMLGAGRMRLAGEISNGQQFCAAPKRIWFVADSAAVIEGEDAGPIGPLQTQDKIGDFWLPQRGIFYADGSIHFDSYEPGHHPLVGAAR